MQNNYLLSDRSTKTFYYHPVYTARQILDVIAPIVGEREGRPYKLDL